MDWFSKKPKSKFTSLYTFIVPTILIGSLFGLAAIFPGCETKQPFKKVELEFWGVFDDSDIYKPLLDDFNKAFSNIKINYRKKTYQTYERDLLEAMASGRGPDIFMIHHTWLPQYQDKIYSVPSEQITPKELQENFVDVVYDDFVIDGNIGALPLSVDSLALYYNKDIFNTVGVPEPARTWEEFLTDVEKITIKDERDNIVRAGVALGTARNINRSTDIICLLMLQSGTEMVNEKRTKAIFNKPVYLEGENFYSGERALQFYTDFANPLKEVYTWNTRMHYSIDAFYEGQTAMMFNYAYHLPTIRAKASYLNFGVAPMPQIKTSTKDINYANYWGLTVSRNCQDSQEAWQFIVWLTEKENAQKYLEVAKKPTARRDLVLWQKDELDLGVFAEQALSARSWHQVDNSSIETILADMIESVILGEISIREAVNKAVNQVTLLMNK